MGTGAPAAPMRVPASRWTQNSQSSTCTCTCDSRAAQRSLAVISRMRVSVALTTRDPTSSGRAIPQCACDSGPILTFFRWPPNPLTAPLASIPRRMRIAKRHSMPHYACTYIMAVAMTSSKSMHQPRCTPDQQLQLEPGLPRLWTDRVARQLSALLRLPGPHPRHHIQSCILLRRFPCQLIYHSICTRNNDPVGMARGRIQLQMRLGCSSCGSASMNSGSYRSPAPEPMAASQGCTNSAQTLRIYIRR
jgi:hypothetical protein